MDTRAWLLVATLLVVPAVPSQGLVATDGQGEPAGATGSAPLQTDNAIGRLLSEQVAAWNAGDARGWSANLAEDAAFINILGMRFDGRQAAERRHAALFESIFKGSHVEMTALRVRVLGDSAAVAETEMELRDFARLPPGILASSGEGILRTRMTWVWMREGGRWRIVLAQNTAVAPAPPTQ
jgi:uncharacterized protein (TIGR02246 family)